MILLVQTSLGLDGVSFGMWLDEAESSDRTWFVVFNSPSFEVSESRIQPFCHAEDKQIGVKQEPAQTDESALT